MSNATVSADIVKIATLGPNGILNVGGGTLSADTTLKLYSTGSSGTVNFIGSVDLNGNSAKIIAGKTVNIFAGVVVTINGPTKASVFTDFANYAATDTNGQPTGGNGSLPGMFGGQGANTDVFANAPALGAVGGP